MEEVTRADREGMDWGVKVFLILMALYLGLGMSAQIYVSCSSSHEHGCRQNDFHTFDLAIKGYYLDTKEMPISLKDLVANERKVKGWDGPYLECGEIPLDPWNRPYIYLLGVGRKYEVISLGADGKVGGEGDDADISSVR